MLRYGVSNLVFDKVKKDVRNRLIESSQICDFAPTALYGSWDAMPDRLPSCPYEGFDMKICSLQSLFFQLQGASLLQDEAGFQIIERQIKRLVRAASQSGAKSLIFGSPGTRKHMTPPIALSELHSRIFRLADVCANADMLLCFEVNSSKFGTEFLVSNSELLDLLATMEHTGLGLHLDLGQMSEAGDDIPTLLKHTSGQLSHLHLSAPSFDLSPERMPLYVDVIAELKILGQPVDVILEVQSLAQGEESALLSMTEDLAQACA